MGQPACGALRARPHSPWLWVPGVAPWLLVVAGCLHTPPKPPPVDGAEGRLQGTWEAVADDDDAEENTLPKYDRLVITDYRFDFVSRDGKVLPGTYKRDASRSPHAIDLTTTVPAVTAAGEVLSSHAEYLPGIYKVEGDTLTLCLDYSLTHKARPECFSERGCKRDCYTKV